MTEGKATVDMVTDELAEALPAATKVVLADWETEEMTAGIRESTRAQAAMWVVVAMVEADREADERVLVDAEVVTTAAVRVAGRVLTVAERAEPEKLEVTWE